MTVICLTPWMNFFFTRISEREFSLDHLHLTQGTGSHQCLLPSFLCAWLPCVLLYFPKQWRICLSRWSWTEYCRALQFHALTAYKSFSLAGYESSRAKWPHSVALLHLALERLHPLKPGVHLSYLEIFFLFLCHRVYNYRKRKGHGGTSQLLNMHPVTIWLWERKKGLIQLAKQRQTCSKVHVTKYVLNYP